MLQARPFSVGKKGVVTLAYAKQFLQMRQRLTYRRAVRIRPEETPGCFARTPVKAEAGKGLIRADVNIGVALTVPQQHIKIRLMLFDEIQLQEERFFLRCGHGDFHPLGHAH